MIVRQQPDLAAQTQALQVLMGLNVADAIGAACSFLLHCAMNHSTEFRRVMHERVVREGFRGVSLLDTFNRICK